MKARGNKSINKRITITFLLVIIIMSVSFLYSNIMKDKVVEEYNLSMEINIMLSDLSVNLNDSWSNFNYYMKSPETEAFIKFTEANKKIEQIIKEVYPHVSQDKDSGIYLRNLTNMYEWYREQTYSVVSKERQDLATYEHYQKIGKMNSYISQHSRNLTSSYLQFTNTYYKGILKKYENLVTKLNWLLIITIIFNVLLVWAVNHDLLAAINKLSRSVKLLSDSNWDIPDIEEQTYKELIDLTKTFNLMKNKLRVFIAQINEKAEIEKNYHMEMARSAEKDKLIKETQLKALQMQINPHFIFNNLNTISRVAMFEGADKTVDIIGALSKILRHNLLNIDKLITLREEIENVQAYIHIQKARFEDRISFQFNIGVEIEYINIPPSLIQLLVENAIIHGLSGFDRKGVIVIQGFIEKSTAIITVEDNGRGMDADCENIRENKSTTGLGLANIRKRLELYYNRSDLLVIQSVEGEGTKVRITIPMEQVA
jgi:two-component system, sensor histidine kinase YesM